MVDHGRACHLKHPARDPRLIPQAVKVFVYTQKCLLDEVIDRSTIDTTADVAA